MESHPERKLRTRHPACAATHGVRGAARAGDRDQSVSSEAQGRSHPRDRRGVHWGTPVPKLSTGFQAASVLTKVTVEEKGNFDNWGKPVMLKKPEAQRGDGPASAPSIRNDSSGAERRRWPRLPVGGLSGPPWPGTSETEEEGVKPRKRTAAGHSAPDHIPVFRG